MYQPTSRRRLRCPAFLLAVLPLFILSGCVVPISATFKGFHDRSFSARSKPAELHSGDVAELLQGEHLLIGHLDFKENIRSCYTDDQCTEISDSGPSTENILARAAELGGDLVSILDEQLELKPVKKSHCTNYYYYTYTLNGQTYTNSACSSYRHTSGFMETWNKRALIWRKETRQVDLDANQRAMDAALQTLAKDYSVQTDTQSPTEPDTESQKRADDKNAGDKEIWDFAAVARDYKGTDPLLNAIVTSNFSELEYQKRIGILTSWRDDEGRNALMASLIRRKWDVAEWLLKQQHHWPGVDKDGFSAIEYAIQFGSPDMLRSLISSTPPTALPKRRVAKLLFFAAGSAKSEQNLKTIITLFGKERIRIRSGFTPLHVAAYQGRRDLFGVLENQGYRANATTKEGITLAMQAAKGGKRSMLEFLLAKSGPLNQRDQNENTLLHYAAQSNDAETLNWLITRGLDINQRNKKGVTPLYAAIISKKWKTSAAILDRRPILTTGRKVLSAAMYTLITEQRSGQLKMFFERLLPFHGDEYYQKLLLLSAAKGNREMIELFADHGFNLNLEIEGSTPLQAALREGNQETMEELIRLGVDPHTKDRRGLTPLMRATRNGDIELVQLLRKGGARY